MINKKICMIGDFAVGKTSLIARYVKNIFSETYISTIGVKIDAKEVLVNENTTLKLLIWDLAGKDSFTVLDDNYIKGASGYLLVADGSRKHTIETAFLLQQHMQDRMNNIPFCMLLNKADLSSKWEITSQEKIDIKKKDWMLYETSAKTGDSVEAAFLDLGKKLV